MRKHYEPLLRLIKSNRALHGMARLAARAVPDLPVTMNVPLLGPTCFGLRRHRWLIGRNSMAGHARNLGMFTRLTREGDVFYDVGANIGYYARFVLRHLSVAHLVAFEPMTANVRLLRRNIGGGVFFERSTILPIALSDDDGQSELQIDDVSDGSAVLSRVSGGEAAQGRRSLGLGAKTETVAVMRLDRAIELHRLPPPNVMKIDTEGAEAIVLAGAERTLREHRPRMIIATHGPDKAEAVIRLLGGLGYYCFGFVKNRGERSAYAELSVEDAPHLADNNIVASVDLEDVRERIEPIDVSNPNQ